MVAERPEQSSDSARAAVLAAFRPGINTTAELLERSGDYSRPAVMRELAKLVDAGKVVRTVRRGEYRLANAAE